MTLAWDEGLRRLDAEMARGPRSSVVAASGPHLPRCRADASNKDQPEQGEEHRVPDRLQDDEREGEPTGAPDTSATFNRKAFETCRMVRTIPMWGAGWLLVPWF